MLGDSTIEGSGLWRAWMRTWRRLPSRVVLIDAAGGETWTAEALTQKALEFSKLLGNYPVGARVAFRLPNGANWLGLFLGIQKAELAAVPLDAATPRAAAFEVARRLGSRALFLEDEMHSLGKGSSARGCCCVKVTSGSDGLPKAVKCRAGHLLADGRQIVATMKIGEADRNLAVIPLGHSYGLGNLVMPLIQQGTALITAGEYVPRQLIEWIGQHKATILPLVPSLLRVLAALPTGRNLGPVRTVISAGAVLTSSTARAFFSRYGLKIHNFYGSSETGGIAYDRTGSASLTGRSVGKPMIDVSVTLKGGRITVRSAAVATRSGSWKLPDVGELNSRGELVLLGRLGEVANIGGRKVHPLEIEKVLRSLSGVTDVLVWLCRDEGRDLLAAAVETSSSRAEIEDALATQLPAWKLPKKYLVAREFPRTSRGKLNTAAVKQKLK